jgi:urease gamma subunit
LVAAAAEVAEARLALGVMMVAVVDAAMIPHYFYREARNGMAVAAAASASAMMSVPAALT